MEPEEFLNISGGVASMKIMFDAFLAVGFTEDQALKLLALMMTLNPEPDDQP